MGTCINSKVSLKIKSEALFIIDLMVNEMKKPYRTSTLNVKQKLHILSYFYFSTVFHISFSNLHITNTVSSKQILCKPTFNS